MRLVWKILKWAIASIVSLAVVIVVAAVVITHTAWFRDYLRAKVNAVLAGTFKGRLVIGTIQGSVWSELALNDVTLTYRGEEIAHIRRLRVAYGLLSILEDTIDLTHLDIEDLDLNARQRADGKWNAAEALASAHPAAPTKGGGKTRFRIFVREASVNGGVLYLTRSDGQTYRIDNPSIAASLYMLKHGMRANLQKLACQLSGPKLPTALLDASLTYQDAISPGSVKIPMVKISTRDSVLEVTGGVSDLHRLAMDLRVDARKIGSGDIARFEPRWSQSAGISGLVRVTGSRPDLHLTMNAGAADSKISGDIHLDLSGRAPGYRGRIDVANLAPAHLIAINNFAGVINASVNGHGAGTSIEGFNGSANARIASLAVNGWNAGDVLLTANAANRVLNYDLKISQGQEASASSRGVVDFRATPSYQVALSASHLDLEKVQGGRILRTDINLDAQVSGSGIAIADANAAARVNWRPSVMGPVRITSGAVRASVARGTVTLSQVQFNAAGPTRVEAKGAAVLTGKRRADISYFLDCKDLAPWMTLAGRKGSGKLQVVGRVNGPLDDMLVRGNLSLTALKTDGVSVAGGQANYYLNGVGGQAHGWVDLGLASVQSKVALNYVYLGVALEQQKPIVARATVNTWDANWREQKLAASIRMASGVTDVSLTTLSLQLPDGTWALPSPAAIHRDDRTLSVSRLHLINGQKQVLVDGKVNFGGAQNMTVLLDGFNLSDANPFLAGNPGLGGVLSVSVRVAGNAGAPIIHARTEIKPLEAKGYKIAGLELQADYGNGRMTAEGAIHQDRLHQLIANANLPMELGWEHGFVAHPAGNIDAHVRSTAINLAMFNPVSPRTLRDFAGMLSINLDVSGPTDHPVANGGVWIWGGKGRIVPLAVSLDSFSTSVSITPADIYLQDLNARSGDGDIDLWGKAAMKGYQPTRFDIALKMSKWPAIHTSEYQLTSAANLKFTGTAEAPRVDGTADILYGVIRPDLAFLGAQSVKPDNTIVVVRNGVPPPQPPPAPVPGKSLFDRLAINVTARVHRDTWVKVSGSFAELQGKVNAVKKPGGPLRLIGGIHTVRGQLALAGQPLTLSKGKVMFTGDVPIDPSLEIEATRQVPNYIVYADVGGTATKPTLKLRSEPEMSQADILAVLMFGRPANGLNNGQQASLQNQAAAIAGSYAATQVGQSVANALGLERLQFTSQNGMVGVGTYLTQNVFISASQNVQQQSQQLPGQASQQATIQYYLSPHWEMDTSQSRSPMGNASEMDLFWHRNY